MSGKRVKLILDENEAVLISDILRDISALYEYTVYGYTVKRAAVTSKYKRGGFVPGADHEKDEKDRLIAIEVLSSKNDKINSINERLRFEMVNKKIKLKK